MKNGSDFTPDDLDTRLLNDCFVLGELSCSRLLLLNNSLVPWFILVPPTSVTEIYKMPAELQHCLLDEINLLSKHIKQHFTIDKLNVAAIGNIVSQLHVHIIGRRQDDYCWPNVVWGAEPKQIYTDDEVACIQSQLIKSLPDEFKAFSLS